MNMACCKNSQCVTKSLNLRLGLETLPDRVTNSGAGESGSSRLELSVFCGDGTSHPFVEVSCGTTALGFAWGSGKIMGTDVVMVGQYDLGTCRRWRRFLT